MFFNLRVAATAALALFTVPSLANNPSPIFDSLLTNFGDLTHQLGALHDTCKQVIDDGGSPNITPEIVNVFTKVKIQIKVTFQAIEECKNDDGDLNNDEIIKVFLAYKQCVETQQKVLEIINNQRNIFYGLIGSIFGHLQDLKSLFDQVTQGLTQICEPKKIDIFDIYKPVANDFNTCLNIFNFGPATFGGKVNTYNTAPLSGSGGLQFAQGGIGGLPQGFGGLPQGFGGLQLPQQGGGGFGGLQLPQQGGGGFGGLQLPQQGGGGFGGLQLPNIPQDGGHGFPFGGNAFPNGPLGYGQGIGQDNFQHNGINVGGGGGGGGTGLPAGFPNLQGGPQGAGTTQDNFQHNGIFSNGVGGQLPSLPNLNGFGGGRLGSGGFGGSGGGGGGFSGVGGFGGGSVGGGFGGPGGFSGLGLANIPGLNLPGAKTSTGVEQNNLQHNNVFANGGNGGAFGQPDTLAQDNLQHNSIKPNFQLNTAADTNPPFAASIQGGPNSPAFGKLSLLQSDPDDQRPHFRKRSFVA